MTQINVNDRAAEPPAGSAPVLSYNVPQQVNHSGQNYIELRLEPSDFIASAAAAQRKEVQR